MSDTLQGLGKLVPGFDFLQGLVKNAGSALPGFTQWVAPTLNPEELEKRIGELRTVQFWLDQNSRMLGTTIQALEVQRMTLSTLKTMNVPLDALREALQVRPPAAEAPAAAPAPEPGPEARPAPAPKARSGRRRKAEVAPEAPAGAVDPMQWWGALTKQFTTLATSTVTEALKDAAADPARHLSGNLMQQSLDAAGETLRKAAAPAEAKPRPAAKGRRQPAAKAPARKRAARS